jgi:EAL and modified HD-GYP domain-containing signal transduction protein
MASLDNAFVARQPIFDRRRKLWGYELFIRQCGEDHCSLSTEEIYLDSTLIADGYSVGAKGVGSDKFICINIGLQTILEDAHAALPKQSVVLGIKAGEDPSRAKALLNQVKKQGYRVCLDYGEVLEEHQSILGLADFLKVSFSDFTPKEIIAIRSKLKKYDCALIAANVEDWQAVEGAKALGFNYFQGYFFSKPEIVPGRKVSNEQASFLRLLRVLAGENIEPQKVLAVISSEPTLAYRLLRYINSPAFGVSNEIASLDRAVHMLGFQPLRSWALAACITCIDNSDKGCVLSWHSLHRAQFLRLAAENNLTSDWNPESAFLLGLFSNIDAVFGAPMADILDDLPLSALLKDALLGKNKMCEWLQLLQALEKGQCQTVQDAILKMGVSAFKASRLYLHATRLASETMLAGEEGRN